MTLNQGTPNIQMTQSEKKRVKRSTRSITRALARSQCLMLPKHLRLGQQTQASVLILPKRTPPSAKPNTPAEQARVDRCHHAVQRALSRDQCLILPQFLTIGTSVQPSILILPRPS